MAVDAVLSGPVSIPVIFAANREVNREFFNFTPSAKILSPNRPAISIVWSEIPYATKKGIFACVQGIIFKEQGIFEREQGIQSCQILTKRGA